MGAQNSGGKRPDLYADILVPVLQVPVGEKGGPGGLPNLPKYWEMEEDGEKKKDDDDEEEEKKKLGNNIVQIHKDPTS